MNIQNVTPTYRAFYDRKVARSWITAGSFGLSPASSTQLATESITSNYITLIESIYLRVTRATAATTVGECAGFVQLSNDPGVRNIIAIANGKLTAAGDMMTYVAYPHIFTYGDDALYVFYYDFSTGGTINVEWAILYETLTKS